MKKGDNKENSFDSFVENEKKDIEENGTETENKYDKHKPVPCLNCGYH